MTLPLLVALGQLADGLAYQLAHGNGTELNPAAALLIGAFGPFAILAVKIAGGAVLGVGALALRRHRRFVSWLAILGFIGALTELGAVL